MPDDDNAFSDSATSAHRAGNAAEVGNRTATTPVSLTIVLERRRHDIDYQVGDTVLEAARRIGVRPPFSCEAGNCATCMAHLDEGTVTMRANNALPQDEVDDGWILTCQSIPTSERVTVNYDA